MQMSCNHNVCIVYSTSVYIYIIYTYKIDIKKEQKYMTKK